MKEGRKMEKEEIQMMSFQLVAHTGEATNHFYQAISNARNHEFEAAEKELELGKQEIVAAHETQTGLLRDEVTGTEIEFSLLLVHAQDHLMTTILFERVARELVEVYRTIGEGGEADAGC